MRCFSKHWHGLLRLLLLHVLVVHSPARQPPVPTRPRSSLRWLSFYNDCAWGLHSNATPAGSASSPPPRPVRSRIASHKSDFVGLPLIEGNCVRPSVCSSPHACDRGMCWLDQLETTQKHNTSSMLSLQTSGPIFCGRTGCAGCLYICPDDCSGYGGLHPELNYSDKESFRGPGAGTCGLEWVRRTVRWTKPLVAAGYLSGFMLGDELSGGMNVGNYTAITDVIHDELEGTEHFVYTNESPHMYLGSSVPSGIDVISFDGYGICKPPGTFCGAAPGINKSEAHWHRELYETRVYPHLMPHQRVAVVPGFFGCVFPNQPGGCEKNWSLHQSRCVCALSGEDLSQEGQERLLIQKADEYFAWALEDAKLVGMAPWHYGNRPSSTAQIASSDAASRGAASAPPSYVNPSMDYGAAQYPGLLNHLMNLGWVNVSQMLPAKLCGLV